MMNLDLRTVIDNEMCIGCGACTAADPDLTLRFDPRTMMYQPSGAGNEAAATVCPALGVDFPRLQSRLFPGRAISPHGVVDAVFLAQSTHHRRNLNASSGGLIKELLRDLLDRGEVDGVITLQHVSGLLFEPALLRDVEEVDSLPGSIYHQVPFQKALEILSSHEGRFGLVAIPCQLEGIFSYIFQHAPHLRNRIHITIGLLCGWLYNHHALKAICTYKGVDFQSITDVSYRGGGPVGKLRLTTPQGETAVSRRIDFGYQVAFDRSFNTRRCHVCVNHSNYLCDIVIGDAWLPGTVFTTSGISLVTCRQTGTADRLRRLAKENRIVLTPITPDDLVESQKRRVYFGDFAYAYADYLRQEGLHTPDMEGPNRPQAHPVPRAEVEAFHRSLLRKLDRQKQGAYRQLWWRKVFLESGRLAARYLQWFVVRILRVKSFLGLRREVRSDQLTGFR